MSLTDPIADLLTRIRNATMRKHSTVSVPYSRIKQRIVEVLEAEGFIEKWNLQEGKSFNTIELHLKYDKAGDSVIRRIERVSRPGLRIHSSSNKIEPVLNGQGIAIITTSKGVFSDRECRRQHVGGEVLCRVW
jgi:small subunit ribosomal protein S8